MKRSAKNGFAKETMVKMKVIEILEARAESLTVNEVVGLLKLSKSFVYGRIASGELPATRYRTGIRLDPNHVIDWVKRLTWQPAMAIPPARDGARTELTSGLERAG
jgi:excisionase family DNA binding protein